MGGRVGLEHRDREILFRVIHIATSPLEIEGLLASAVELLAEAVGAEACFIYLVAEDSDLVLRAASPPYRDAVGLVRLTPGEGVAGWAAANGQGVLLASNPMSDPRYRYIPELEGERFAAMMSVPLISRSGRLIGVLNAHASTPGRFTDDDLRLVESAASIVAGGIENAELVRLTQRKEEALAALVRETIQVQEEERRRVATEIHDGVTQQLVSIWYRVHAVQRLLERGSASQALVEIEAAKELIDATLAETRSAIYNLRPSTLDDLGLVPALHELARRFGAESGVVARVTAPAEIRLAPHIETALYRITQEALSNVRKHAEASTVTVTLEGVNGSVRLAVSDDGAGFDVAAFLESRSQTSFGLAGMRERVELVGGRLDISSARGRGTTLTVTVPIQTGTLEVVA